jgi:hypothetical protein
VKRTASLLIALAVIAAPAVAAAQTLVIGAPPDAVSTPPAPRPDVHFDAGLRGMLISSPGFDPYAGNDLLMQLSLGAGLTVLRAGNVSILLFARWDWGSRTDVARGEDTSLEVHRLGGGAETRWQLARRFYLSAKLSPAALYLRGSIADTSIDRLLVSRTWTWGLDVTGGAGLLMAGRSTHGTGFWLTGDLGYAFAGTSAMTFAPASSTDDPRKFGSVMLPSIRPSGPVSRLGLALSF